MSSRLFLAAIFIVVLSLIHADAKGDSKYSKEKNRLKEETLRDAAEFGSGRAKSGHFRVARLDGIWERAQKVEFSRRFFPFLKINLASHAVFPLQSLSVDDQRDIFEELQELDQDEITLKRLRHDGGDKAGSCVCLVF